MFQSHDSFKKIVVSDWERRVISYCTFASLNIRSVGGAIAVLTVSSALTREDSEAFFVWVAKKAMKILPFFYRKKKENDFIGGYKSSLFLTQLRSRVGVGGSTQCREWLVCNIKVMCFLLIWIVPGHRILAITMGGKTKKLK